MLRSPTGTSLSLAALFVCFIFWLSRGFDASYFSSTKHSAESNLPDDSDSVPNALQTSGRSPAYGNPSSAVKEYPAAFPRIVWQTSSLAGKTKYADNVRSWSSQESIDYRWLSDDDADAFVQNSFAESRPSLVKFWNDLSSGLKEAKRPAKDASESESNHIVVDSTASSAIVLRADLLRYMVMLVGGGVYADIDTTALVPIAQWIPEEFDPRDVNAVIGIEYDDITHDMFIRPMSFSQWTLMSKPGHPIFVNAIDRVISNLEYIARRQRIHSLSKLKLEFLDVLEATGPGMISDVVLTTIQNQLPDRNITWTTFHEQKKATLFGDILILPINGFGSSSDHSHAKDPEYGPMLVAHHFGRSWYQPG